MNLVLEYAVVGFRPRFELGEFLNVGVVAVEAESRYLCHRLLPPQRTRRIAACFPEFDLPLYRAGLGRLEDDLAALAVETNRWTDEGRRSGRTHPAQRDLFTDEVEVDLFRRLTAPRTSPFFFAARGTRLTDDVEACLDALYRRYVEKTSLPPADYEEKRLTRDLRRLLQAGDLARLYREAPWVGTEAYHVGIPLAFTPGGAEVPAKAIKPLNLARATPTRIYTHGDEWIAKLRRLKRVGCLPAAFLFVVKKSDEPERRAAAEDICEGLALQGAEVVDVEDEEAILTFARVEEGWGWGEREGKNGELWS